MSEIGMTTNIDLFRYQKWLRGRIARLEEQQERRIALAEEQRLAALQVIEKKALEIANMRAQLVG